MRAWPILLVAAALAAMPAPAHEVRPAYLEIREAGADRVDVLWKVPARGDYSLAIDVRLPPQCETTASRAVLTGATRVERRQALCPGGIVGGQVAIAGLAGTRTDVLARYLRADGSVQVARLTPTEPAFTLAGAPRTGEVARAYSWLGFEHILRGADHLLFVLALLLLVSGWRRVIGTVTAFTVAHSLTLEAASLGVLHVPAAPVEAVIALSVMFVAAEVVAVTRGRPGLIARAPWAAAFAFGLLHGLGFAGALTTIGLPAGDVPVALLFFNVGVELGQLLFIAVAVGLARLAAGVARHAGVSPGLRADGARVLLGYGIGSVAAFWVIDRVAAFWA